MKPCLLNSHLDTLELVTTQHLVLAPLMSVELKRKAWGEASGLQDVSAKDPAGKQQMMAQDSGGRVTMGAEGGMKRCRRDSVSSPPGPLSLYSSAPLRSLQGCCPDEPLSKLACASCTQVRGWVGLSRLRVWYCGHHRHPHHHRVLTHASQEPTKCQAFAGPHLLDSHRSSLVFQGCDFSRSRSQTVAVQGLDLGRLAQSLCP